MLLQTLVLATACLADITVKFNNQPPNIVETSQWENTASYFASFASSDRTTLQDSVSFSAPAKIISGKTSYKIEQAILVSPMAIYIDRNMSPMTLKILVGDNPTPAITADLLTRTSSFSYFSLKSLCFTIPDSDTELTFVFDASKLKKVLKYVKEVVLTDSMDIKITLAPC